MEVEVEKKEDGASNEQFTKSMPWEDAVEKSPMKWPQWLRSSSCRLRC